MVLEISQNTNEIYEIKYGGLYNEEKNHFPRRGCFARRFLLRERRASLCSEFGIVLLNTRRLVGV